MKTADNKGIFDSPHAQIADSFNVYRQKPPPEDHPNAIVCVQCEELTWRLTDCCIHCGFNMDAYAQEQIRLEQLEQLRRDQQKLKNKLIPFFVSMLFCLLGTGLGLYLSSTNPFIYWAVIAVMLLLVVFIKPLIEKIDNIRHQIRELE